MASAAPADAGNDAGAGANSPQAAAAAAAAAAAIAAVTLILAGDQRVGKSQLMFRVFYERFSADDVPDETFRSFKAEKALGKRRWQLSVIDTKTITEFRTVVPKVSEETPRVFLLCFALNDRVSLRNAIDLWFHEFGTGQPVILVGTKLDLRQLEEAEANEQAFSATSSVSDDEVPHQPFCIRAAEGRAAAKQIDAAAYIECSAVTGEGIDKLLDALTKVQRSSGRCALL